MKIVVTGTVGLDKGMYLEKVCRIAQQRGQQINLCHLGRRMYGEAPDVAAGRILDLPIARLRQLRRSVFKDILNFAQQDRHLIVNTHATFRWRHGLFPAFDFDHIAQLNADMYVCLIDNIDSVHARLTRDHQIDHSLKDMLVWREEEIFATKMMMRGCSWRNRQNSTRADPTLFGQVADEQHWPQFHIMAIGQNLPDGNSDTAEMFYRLMMCPNMPKAYLSFPMTHVTDMPEVLDQINRFRSAVGDHFIVFDPADLEEQRIYQEAQDASERGRKVMEIEVLGRTMQFDVAEIMQVAGDIHCQIYARDFMLIDQADMIISYIPQMPDGKPGLSSGVERELQHAHEATKEVYVIWRPNVPPSPFITETATKVFSTTNEALDYFKGKKYITNN